jgi:hypothetical protein
VKNIVAIVMVGALSAAGCAPALPLRPTTAAQTSSRWDDVVALRSDTPVRVWTVDQGRLQCTLVTADSASLWIRTKSGAVLLPATSVQRVDRLPAPGSTRGRVRRAIISAAAGALLAVATTPFCRMMGDKTCSAPTSPQAVAATSVVLGGIGAFVDERKSTTIYRAAFVKARGKIVRVAVC